MVQPGFDDAPSVYGYFSARDSGQALRIQLMLRRLEPPMQALGRILVQHRHRLLRYDRPAVNPGIDEMDRAARHLDAVFQRLLPCFQPGKGWKQRRMNVYNPAFKHPQKFTLQDAHESSQGYQIHVRFPQSRNKGAFGVVRQFSPKISRRNESRRDAQFASSFQNSSVSHVAYNNRDLSRQLPSGAVLSDSGKVRTLARTQNADPEISRALHPA